MNIETKSIQLSVASVKLDGKKITNAILDQIPRLGFCAALITDEAEYKQNVNLTPVCRFSLATFLQSESRIFKFKAREHELRGHLRDLNYQDEAYLFTLDGNLYCGTYSSSHNTPEYGPTLNALEKKITNANVKVSALRATLEMHQSGISPISILKQLDSPQITQDYSYRFHDDDEDDRIARIGLANILKKYGNWDKFIESVHYELPSRTTQLESYRNQLDQYKKSVLTILEQIRRCPFVYLGI